MLRTVLGAGLVLALAAGCGGGAESDCPEGCPTCQECVVGICVPIADCDGGTGDGGGDVPEPDDGTGRDEAGREDGVGPDDGGRPDDAMPPDDGAGPDDAMPPDDGVGPDDAMPPDDAGVPDDAGMPDDAGPGAELCNGWDDDGDGFIDEGFPCAAGAPVVCRTGCGTSGVGTCTATCQLPEPAACTPPSETCNGRDDDCDGACDDGFACCSGMTVACTTMCGSRGSAVCGIGCAPGSCTPPAETCNGVDDDCDGTCDDGFACCAGDPVACTTTCGSAGTATCTEACAAGACAPPLEACGNGRDDDCDTAVDEGCAVNDTCSGATSLTFGTPITGSTASSSDDSSAPCVTATGGRDVYYTFNVTAAADVFCHAVGSAYDTVLYGSATCGGGDLGCNDDIYYGYVTAAAVTLPDLDPGAYYLAVDGFSTTGGNYSLMCYQTPADTAGDRCGNPVLIPRPTSGTTGQIRGNTCSLGNEYTASCVSGDTGEAVYYFALRDRRTVTLSTCNTETVADTAIYVRRGCGTADADLFCNDNAASGTGTCSTLTALLEPGLYFVFVDTPISMLPVCGAFRLDLTGAW